MTQDDLGQLAIDDVCEVVSEAIVRRHGKAEPIDADTQMLITGMLDSLTLVNIVAELEKRLGRKLPEDMVVARNFRTPTTLHTAVTAVLAERV
ncbi:acyl carrier protein [Gordonia sp. HY285]|uniref:Acyl carrier protein n=1 Tax=Gordonia liuliyuniae TaxID=2911517 RepID=A0ABS9IMZ1_9ACTN|nr:acyl carrier protein [Gordonia liuliyuniae]MCF8586914.1 acyl carrier protein [Gordonia liuliyuniae]MCF8609761.1 acyl carrier protein [Gordonia liuliyuniae]